MNIEDKIQQSERDFREEVLPEIRDWFPDEGEIIAVEGNATDRMRKMLDMHAGVDAFVVRPGIGVRGIANRVRYGNRYRRTFTISAPDENANHPSAFEKRVTAVQSDYVMPYWMVTAFFDERGGELLRVGMCKVKDLISQISHGTKGRDYVLKTPRGRRNFYSVEWNMMSPDDVQIREFDV
ncbi:hypothetical protein DNAM5_144 [Haloarcula californiae tailed virus 1]|uniref:Uncharacterized protein n=1 Tax=Haloarcula californiae tailed virus 1 TaxID=1273746 RepID=R4TI33_9CAUD|nr:hypothetical protein M202_gp077 [Haloarcula californiae tailed virus 1]AGM12001.1 hypothetical protein DNAM5_144 [Haloarcula californiae tailed virus 1]